jgi:predicted glycoside hydrolase/deacetylase ChbG (UPF0249 family)
VNGLREPACLVVNADDYAYYRGVSRGILEAAARGIVTATGVFANAARFEEDVPALRECAALDAGVHLNLTDGRPLTPDMRNRLARWGGQFPRKFAIAAAVLAGAVRVRDVEVEWRAQIERCLGAGLKLQFLNSHEHIHMLPALFPLTLALAERYRIPHLRFATASLARSVARGTVVRGAIITGLAAICRRRVDRPVARFLGLEASGRLTLAELDSLTADLQPGGVYELMCHPGRLDRAEIADPRLLRYHDWEGELAALTAPRARALLDERGIRLARFRDIEADDGRLRPAGNGDSRRAQP